MSLRLAKAATSVYCFVALILHMFFDIWNNVLLVTVKVTLIVGKVSLRGAHLVWIGGQVALTGGLLLWIIYLFLPLSDAWICKPCCTTKGDGVCKFL